MRSFFKIQPLLKLLSIGMALFLWFYVRAERKLETNLDVNVEVVDLPENLVISREFESVLQVRVIGPSSRVEALKRSHSITYKLNLGKAKKGHNTVWIHEEELNLPYGVKIIQVIPQVVKVYLDRSEEKTVPIVPRFNGKLEYGIDMVGYEITPETVKIKGTHDDLVKLQKIYTFPVQLAGRTANFEEQVPLETMDKYVNIGNPNVNIKVTIKENKVTKKIKNLQVLLVPQSLDWEVAPSEVNVVLTGMASQVAAMDKRLEPYVDISKVNALSKEMIWVQPKLKGVSGISYKFVPERLRLIKRRKR